MSNQNRRPFIAGNWKMNLSLAESKALAQALASELGDVTDVDIAVGPATVYLADTARALAGSNIAVAAQNMYFEDNGAFTGEISAAMVKDTGCSCVILGHSERRHVMGESDELINKKVLKGLSEGLHVILCVGELLEERKADQTFDVVSRQIKTGLEGVDSAAIANVTIAYEPVWAIGTGETASPAQAQDVHKSIRDLLEKMYDAGIAGAIRIQYGGSVKPGNAAELLGQCDVDGALVGGAALKASDFVAIVRAGI